MNTTTRLLLQEIIDRDFTISEINKIFTTLKLIVIDKKQIKEKKNKYIKKFYEKQIKRDVKTLEDIFKEKSLYYNIEKLTNE